jgi:hypothetical protein
MVDQIAPCPKEFADSLKMGGCWRAGIEKFLAQGEQREQNDSTNDDESRRDQPEPDVPQGQSFIVFFQDRIQRNRHPYIGRHHQELKKHARGDLLDI